MRPIVREVHPELSFRAWNDGQSMTANKKTAEGRNERRRLIDSYFDKSAFDRVRREYKVKDVAHDDILDAFAALWTAERIARREALTLPEDPEFDGEGLAMSISY